jgi:uncharacterized protein (TIGR02099 family)
MPAGIPWQASPRIHVQSLAPSLVIRLLRLTGTAIIAAVVVFCVTLLAIRFVVFPNIDNYRGPIAAKLSHQLGQQVAIDSLSGGWDGWNPKLAITGFAIRDRALPTGAPVLLLPRVDLLVAWTSLLVFDLRLKELSIERPELSIRRDALGRLHIAGFEIDPEAQDDDAPFMNWLLRQRQIVVRNALVTWNDELRGSPELVLDNVMFRLERGLAGYRFGLVGSPPAALASPLDFRGEVSAGSLADWRQAKGRFFVRLDYADVAKWRNWIPLLRPVESGRGALRAWFDFAGGKATDVVADVELSDVRARTAPDLPQLDLAYLGGRITWKRDPGKRVLTTRGLTFRTASGQVHAPLALNLSVDESADGTITGGQMDFDHLEVAPLSLLAAHLPLPELWRRDLASLALRGSVTGGKVTWTGPPDSPTTYSGSGAFTRFGVAAGEALPGAAGVSGNFTINETGGNLKLDSRDMSMSLPRVFADALQFSSASGQVRWTRGDDGLLVNVDELRFATPRTSGSANGSWRSRPKGPGLIELNAQLVRADARDTYRYLPLTLDPQIRDWLRTSIPAGTITDVKTVVAGDLADFPFADPRRGKFSVTFKTSGVTLDYAQGWPQITGIDASVKLESTGITIEATRGEMFGAALGPVKASIPQLGAANPLLTIEGEASGRTTDFLRFVEASPVAGWIGHATDGAAATGNGRLAVRFALPLGKAEGVKLAGDYRFIDNELRLAGTPALTKINGKLEFTEQTLHARDLSAELFGDAIKLAVESADGQVRFDAGGTTNLRVLRSELDWPLLDRVTGAVDWRLEAHSRAGATEWTLDSDLKGAAIDLPAPIGKAATDVAKLRIERRGSPGRTDQDLLTIDYRGDMRMLAHRTLAKDGASVDRALLLLGPAVARGGVPDRPGLWVRGQIGDFDLDEWLALRAKMAARSADATAAHVPDGFDLNGVDIEVGRIDVFGRGLHDLKVSALRAGNDWRLRLAGREVEGTAVWHGPATDLPNGRVMARLTRLVSPGADELHPARSEVDDREKSKNTWPELDIAADSFVSRDHDLGKVELLAKPQGTDWRISRLSLANPGGRIDGSGWWHVARDRPTTEIDITVAVEDAGAFLNRFGYPVAVLNAPTKITGRLAWDGAPNDFDYPTLTGGFKLATGAGQFTKIDPGIGKLLGVLSLQSLSRRITLDFQDVFSEGFAFDEINGDFEIKKGLMRTSNLKLEGPAATALITGEIDLGRETQILDVRVKPALSSTFSAGAAVLFLANPIVGAAVGAGTLLAQKLLDNPLGQMFSYDYRVTGSWSDPQVTKIGTRTVPEGGSVPAEVPTR